ncbi:hypothetical protein RFI_11480 [Reticulomyxa filosa]|uniref:Integrase catalytic domain-containing protein n=1 Tax=Reticulomyxa filosa TaxID=46433 RepID=X6NIC1_RETFI|nr:hypothetical protein RFI_11480 [Reticulomyxa filosa]|eukprot:ETO25658.1 hypothetical protein RFI_11480 [Reticulomyxa filosa]
MMKIKQLFKSSYHPQTNWMIERFHGYLKERLVIICVYQKFANKPETLHKYKRTLQKQLTIILEKTLLMQKAYDAKRKVFENKNNHKDNFSVDSVLLFVDDQRVWNKSKILPKFVGPYTVIQCLGQVTLKIESEHYFQKIVHISKVRKLNMEDETPRKDDKKHSNEDVPQLDTVYSSPPPLENLNDSLSSLENSNAPPPPLESCNNFEEVVTVERKGVMCERNSNTTMSPRLRNTKRVSMCCPEGGM